MFIELKSEVEGCLGILQDFIYAHTHILIPMDELLEFLVLKSYPEEVCQRFLESEYA